MKNRSLWLAGTALALYVIVPVAHALPSVGANENPTGGAFVGGSAAGTITGAGTSYETVTQNGSKGIVNWNTFNIGSNATTEFKQNGGVTLNRINDSNPSQIFGHLKADGTVMLVNKNGIMFQPGSTVDVGSLVATTHDIQDATFNNTTNGKYSFDGAAGNAGSSVQNAGNITVKQGGIAALVAPSVVNNGVITAKMAKVSLAGGEKFTVDLNGDGLVSLAVPTASGKVTQGSTGQIIADAGTVQLTAKSASNLVDSMVNVDGIVQAQTVANVGGKIVLDADNAVVSNNVSNNANAAEVDVKNATGTSKVDVNAGIALVGTNGTVKLDQGTYNNGEVFMNKKGVTLAGATANAADTKLNLSTQSFGVLVTADNSSLKNLTVNNATGNTSGLQNGIKITGNVSTITQNLPPVNGVTIQNVAVTGGAKGGKIDANGANNLTLDHVSVDGNNTGNGGIVITDSNHVNLSNISTKNDSYGIALQTTGKFAKGGINDVNITGSNSFGEDAALFTSVSNYPGGTPYALTNVYAPDMKFATQSSAINNGGYGLYSTNQPSAINVALSKIAGAPDVVVQGLDNSGHLVGNNQFYVGESANQQTQMSIQAAVNAAQPGGTVNVLAGSYKLPSTLNIDHGVTLSGAGNNTGTGGTQIAANFQNAYGMDITGNNVTLQHFQFTGPAGNNAYGLKIEPASTAHDASINNVTLSDLTVRNSGKTNIDVNGANNVVLNNVTALNAARGAGLSVTDSNNVAVNNLQTSGNSFGGVLIQAKTGGSEPYDRNTNNVTIDQASTFQESNPLYTEESNGLTVNNLNPGKYVYIVSNPNYDQTFRTGVGKTTFYRETRQQADMLASLLSWFTETPSMVSMYTPPVANSGLSVDDDAATRETTRRASGGPGSVVASLGTGNVFDLLQPAAGGDSDNQDVSQRPLAADELAVGQNFLQSGQVTSGPVALNKLLSQAGVKKPAQ